MRLSRPCYDKAHRCPGWVGGGMRSAKIIHCGGGSLRRGHYYEGLLWRWRFNRHEDCDTLVLPYVVRWLDPTWWAFVVDRRLQERDDRRNEDGR